MEEVDKDAIGYELTREDMAKLCSTKYLLGGYERDLLVWHHKMNYCSLKSPLRISNRVIIPRKLRNIRTPPLVSPDYLESITIVHGGPKAPYV